MINYIYFQKESIIHGIDFWSKFFVLLIILPFSVFIIPIHLIFIIITYVIILIIVSNIRFSKLWYEGKKLIIPITFSLILLSLIFSNGSISSRFFLGLFFSIRFAIMIILGLVFSYITNPIELSMGLIRARIPQRYGITLMTSYRMYPLLSNKISQIYFAQKARGADFSFSIKKIPKLLSLSMSLIIPIILASLELSLSLSDTLISRGYNPNAKITIPPTKIKIVDVLFPITSIIILVISLL